MKPENIVLAALVLLGLSPADSTLVAISARLQAASEDVTPLSLIRFLSINLRDIGPIAICVACSVVCVLGTLASPAKADEPIEMPFVMQTRMGPRNHVHGVSLGSVGPLESKLQAA